MSVQVTKLENGSDRGERKHAAPRKCCAGDLGQGWGAQRKARGARHCPSAGAHGLQGHRPAVRPSRSPRKSRMSAATSTPRPASRPRPTMPASCATTCRWPSTSCTTFWPIRHSTKANWSASSTSSCRRSARQTTRPDDLVFDVFQDTAFAGQTIGRPILGTPETVSSLHGRAICAIISPTIIAGRTWCSRLPGASTTRSW